MVHALYRRYRPETFAELIGQSQVTDPLRHALTTDRVNHAYLFSGPRGCGKTTSARILARCLNCEQGPTDTPCGVCPSCVELSRDGGGSLDVVEIDAASHNGVDDARELRERAVFAPARDRFKIFILDEAHMVTPQGFNALLKIVEEPPEHVKFIFATTEPDKVIGTIRSRTHHYPFRLVPPAELLRYVEQMCSSEGVAVEEGVLPLVVRAGGGSVRDTLSVLDQLIAGSPDATVTYDRAVALLGYTHGELLAEVMTAIAAGDGPGSFQALDKVIHSGQDPRRFAEDLLEFTRDIIVVDAAGSAATALLPGTSAPVIDQMTGIASSIGGPRLSAIADVINDALMAMTGATSPKLHLELLMARLLVSMGAPATPHTVAELPLQQPVPPASPPQNPVSAPAAPDPAPSAPAEPLSLELMVASWGKIVEAVGEKNRAVWTALADTEVVALADDVVTIGFPSLASAEVLKKPQGRGLPVNAELVRDAILAVSGHRVRFKVQELVSESAAEEAAETVTEEAPAVVETSTAAATTASWPTVTLPGAEEQPAEHVSEESADEAAEEEPEVNTPTTGALSQVGEAVIREVLGGQLISEHPVDGAEDK
ncbi:MAG: DNA polymerase III subunit gamma and tau [Pontimonas sp.]|nr:DNA polymerase III subunit gamma and tau [Pontimonas sp.]